MQPIAVLILPGLNTPATGDCHTMVPLVHNFMQSESPDSIYTAIEYNCININAARGFFNDPTKKRVVLGHSFGGAAAMWLMSLGLYVDLAVLFDPAPNQSLFNQSYSWQEARQDQSKRWQKPASCTEALCFTQTKDAIWLPGENHHQDASLAGVCGVPLASGPKVLNVDCTSMGLGHNDIPADPFVHELTVSYFRRLAA